jgi:hypothetical protein
MARESPAKHNAHAGAPSPVFTLAMLLLVGIALGFALGSTQAEVTAHAMRRHPAPAVAGPRKMVPDIVVPRTAPDRPIPTDWSQPDWPQI